MALGDGTKCKTCFGSPRMVLCGPPSKTFSFFQKQSLVRVDPPPWFGESPDFLLDLSCETFPYQNQKQFLADFKIRVPIRPNYFFDFPIVRSTIKIDLNLSVTYQNLLGEPQKSNGQSELPAKRKRPKPSKITIFRESGIFGWFLDVFSLLVTRIDLILFPLNFYCSPDRF